MIGLNNEPEFSTTIYFPLRRTLVLQQVYSTFSTPSPTFPLIEHPAPASGDNIHSVI